jgi:hypothetical protein
MPSSKNISVKPSPITASAAGKKKGNVELPMKKIIKLLYGSSKRDENLCFEGTNGPAPNSIDFQTLVAKPIPYDWGEKIGGRRAATGEENLARLMGSICVSVICAPGNVSRLTSTNLVGATVLCSSDGEYDTAAGQIPVSRLADMLHRKEIKIHNDISRKNIQHLLTLQIPASSKWGRPFIRTISNHSYNENTHELSVRLYIYFTRLIFELIADPTIKHLMDHIERKPFNVIPIRTRPLQPVLFKSTELDPKNRFSLSGLLKHTESKGYTLAETQPTGLSVQLYDFQLSTYQWMLDQEKLEGGLNGFFWEVWEVWIS